MSHHGVTSRCRMTVSLHGRYARSVGARTIFIATDSDDVLQARVRVRVRVGVRVRVRVRVMVRVRVRVRCPHYLHRYRLR